MSTGKCTTYATLPFLTPYRVKSTRGQRMYLRKRGTGFRTLRWVVRMLHNSRDGPRNGVRCMKEVLGSPGCCGRAQCSIHTVSPGLTSVTARETGRAQTWWSASKTKCVLRAEATSQEPRMTSLETNTGGCRGRRCGQVDPRPGSGSTPNVVDDGFRAVRGREFGVGGA